MRQIKLLPWFRGVLILCLAAGLLGPATGALAQPPRAEPAQGGEVTAFDLIIAMNTLRMSNGLPALVEDPIVNAVAQSTAQIMAANEMSWHIGDVKGRLAAAGYGGGDTVWATENFAVGTNHTIDQIMIVWSDASHMIPAVNAAYCHIGAGTAKSANGRTYYVLQAAYVGGKSCGAYTSPGGGSTGGQPGGGSGSSGVSQLIVPVKVATPDADGKVFHEVQAGQSFWAIAITYKVTIKDLETWNNLTSDSKLQIGQRLFIPGSNTEGYATPTPVGMIQVSTPDAGGKVVHAVQSYQTLITISQAYGVSIDRILALNGLQVDWPLQIDQKLLIDPGSVTPSPTPRPLTALEMLTPESDGKYYHTIQSGETLWWIAELYEVSMNDLMAWNGLNGASIVRPGEKLVLQVTPPATETPTPPPATATVAPPTPQATASPTPPLTQAVAAAAVTAGPASGMDSETMLLYLSIGLTVGGLFLVVFFSRKK